MNTAKEFIEELKVLCDRYAATIKEFPQYDNEEEYCGSVYSFWAPTWSVDINEELLDD